LQFSESRGTDLVNDVNRDGISDLIARAFLCSGTEVKFFNFPELDLLFSFFIGEPRNTGGVYVG